MILMLILAQIRLPGVFDEFGNKIGRGSVMYENSKFQLWQNQF